VAETWLLLNRHPGDGRLYQWGAWYFDLEKQYGETTRLMRAADLNHVSGPWMDLHGAFRAIRENRLDEAEALLRRIPDHKSPWQISANMGRLLEVRRSASSALDYYEIAAAQVKNPRSAARVQIRIARCLRTLGQERESRRVLEYTLDLDPDNLSAQLELRRLQNEGI
jgi:tetratricopeptide (TPR) repeat protein